MGYGESPVAFERGRGMERVRAGSRCTGPLKSPQDFCRAQGCRFKSDHPDKIEREVVQLAERVLWEHEAAGSSPALPTDVEIGVRVNTAACGAVDTGSNPISQPTMKQS